MKIFKSLLAVSLSVFMAAESVPAFPYGSTPSNAFLINIPSSLGFVTESWYASTEAEKPDVILIQNLHVNRSVQFAISGILKRLKAQGMMPDHIGIEGASGPVDIGFMQRYPDPVIRRKAADYLVQQGEMPGVMHFAVSEGSGGLFGIETDEYYQANLEMFQHSYKERAALREEIEKIQAVLPKLKGAAATRENARILEKDVNAVSALINNQVIPDELPATLRQATEAVEHLKLVLPKDSAAQLIEPLSASINFYALALLRNDELLKNALAVRELGHQKTSILVTGGFHTAALAEGFKKRGLSYAVITPNIKRADKVDETLYVERLLDHHLTPQQIETGRDWASEGVMQGPMAAGQLEATLNFITKTQTAWEAATRIPRFLLGWRGINIEVGAVVVGAACAAFSSSCGGSNSSPTSPTPPVSSRPTADPGYTIVALGPGPGPTESDGGQAYSSWIDHPISIPFGTPVEFIFSKSDVGTYIFPRLTPASVLSSPQLVGTDLGVNFTPMQIVLSPDGSEGIVQFVVDNRFTGLVVDPQTGVLPPTGQFAADTGAEANKQPLPQTADKRATLLAVAIGSPYVAENQTPVLPVSSSQRIVSWSSDPEGLAPLHGVVRVFEAGLSQVSTVVEAQSSLLRPIDPDLPQESQALVRIYLQPGTSATRKNDIVQALDRTSDMALAWIWFFDADFMRALNNAVENHSDPNSAYYARLLQRRITAKRTEVFMEGAVFTLVLFALFIGYGITRSRKNPRGNRVFEPKAFLLLLPLLSLHPRVADAQALADYWASLPNGLKGLVATTPSQVRALNVQNVQTPQAIPWDSLPPRDKQFLIWTADYNDYIYRNFSDVLSSWQRSENLPLLYTLADLSFGEQKGPGESVPGGTTYLGRKRLPMDWYVLSLLIDPATHELRIPGKMPIPVSLTKEALQVGDITFHRNSDGQIIGASLKESVRLRYGGQFDFITFQTVKFPPVSIPTLVREKLGENDPLPTPDPRAITTPKQKPITQGPTVGYGHVNSLIGIWPFKPKVARDNYSYADITVDGTKGSELHLQFSGSIEDAQSYIYGLRKGYIEQPLVLDHDGLTTFRVPLKYFAKPGDIAAVTVHSTITGETGPTGVGGVQIQFVAMPPAEHREYQNKKTIEVVTPGKGVTPRAQAQPVSPSAAPNQPATSVDNHAPRPSRHTGNILVTTFFVTVIGLALAPLGYHAVLVALSAIFHAIHSWLNYHQLLHATLAHVQAVLVTHDFHPTQIPAMAAMALFGVAMVRIRNDDVRKKNRDLLKQMYLKIAA